MKLIIYLFLLCIFSIGVKSYGESDSNGTPSWRERESLALINFVRMHPIQYRDLYMSYFSNYSTIFSETSLYFPVKPIYFNATATALAQYHSKDMGVNNCFSHNDCNGNSSDVRRSAFLSGCGLISGYGENIAAGSATGFLANNMLICDAPDPNNPVCTYDGSPNDGHRRNIMSPTKKIIGIGYYYAPSSVYKHYYTQDLFGGGCNIPTTAIYSGFHTTTKTGALNFIVTYYDSSIGATKMSLAFENNTKINLPISYGNSTFGTYIYTQATFSNCVKYYFEAQTSTKTIRYPDTGFLQLTKDDTCAAWVASTTSTTSSASAGGSTTSAGGSSTSVGSSTSSTGSSTSTSSSTSTDGSISNSNILKPIATILLSLSMILMY